MTNFDERVVIDLNHERQADALMVMADMSSDFNWYTKSEEARHTNPNTINTLGDSYLRAGKVQEAIACFSQVAERYSSSGHVAKSIAVLKKISRLTPSDPEILMRIGDLLAMQGRVGEARTSYLCVGDSEYLGDRPEAAITAYEKAIAVDKSNAPLHTMLGGLYLDRGMLGKAHASFISARREYLKKGEISLARHAAASAHSIEGISQFQAYRDSCRRKEERYALRLPTVVMAENRKWCEDTVSLNISKSGIRLRLVRPLELDRVVGLVMRVPSELGLGTADDSTYAVNAIVCHSEKTVDGQCIVGAEFGNISKLAV
jgi:tetratricopeptide (TPR) repeat protein